MQHGPPEAQRLLARLDEFLGFARKRLGDPDLAAEAVQEAFSKAIARIAQLEDEERLVAWYYRILRNVIADLGQRRARQPVAMADDGIPAVTSPDRAEVCACVGALLDELPPQYARALRKVEFEGASLEQAAAAEGITVNNLKQRRHRAREQLRELLLATCRVCAAHGCLDCTCQRSTGGSCH